MEAKYYEVQRLMKEGFCDGKKGMITYCIYNFEDRNCPETCYFAQRQKETKNGKSIIRT